MNNYLKFTALLASGIVLGTIAGRIVGNETKTKRSSINKTNTVRVVHISNKDKDEDVEESSVHYFI
ncbi:MAG: hypothetical protein ACFCUU_07485 [Cyclobacteriaceae bacterium]